MTAQDFLDDYSAHRRRIGELRARMVEVRESKLINDDLRLEAAMFITKQLEAEYEAAKASYDKVLSTFPLRVRTYMRTRSFVKLILLRMRRRFTRKTSDA